MKKRKKYRTLIPFEFDIYPNSINKVKLNIEKYNELNEND